MIQPRFGHQVAVLAFGFMAASCLWATQAAVAQFPFPPVAPNAASVSPNAALGASNGTSIAPQGDSGSFPPHAGPEIIQSSGRPGANSGARRLLIRLPGTETGARGNIAVRPQVQVVPTTGQNLGGQNFGTGLADPSELLPSGAFSPGPIQYSTRGVTPEVLPPPQGSPQGLPLGVTPELLPGESILGGPGAPIFGELLDDSLPSHPQPHGFLSRLLSPHRSPYDDRGLGHERVMMAPFELDITQPQNNIRLRLDNAYGFEFPDRAEYFWAAVGGRGPDAADVAAFEQVDYQDVRFMFEVGGPKFSIQTEAPIRFLDGKDDFYNTAGFGDMSVKTKLVMIDGRRWQVTQYFGTYMPTGAPGHGTGTGHTSIEPGFLFRYMINDATYWHGEVKYWVPLGGDPNHSGQIFRWGTGISYLWYESDAVAIIPTMELVSWTVLDGLKSGRFLDGADPPASVLEVDGETTVNLYPGVRMSYDSGCDLGLFEFGIQGGFTITETYWYAGILRLEARFVY